MSVNQTHSPCATCGVCCRSYIVPLSGYDVWRISTSQHLAPEQFVIALESGSMRGDGFRLVADGPIYALMLDKRGRLKVKQACIFLVTLADTETRCGIYADRPAVCRSYPMIWQKGRIDYRPKALCPPGGWAEDEPRRASWRRNVQRTELCFDVYLEVLNRWNTRVKRAAGRSFHYREFYSYLLNVYDRLAALDATMSPAVLERIADTWAIFPGPDANLPDLRPQTEAHPWVDYLYRVREIVDTFYPEIPPLPFHEAVTEAPEPESVGK
jgi:Fe-S-cluster containining protein